MRLTYEKLRQIINEEIRRLNEADENQNNPIIEKIAHQAEPDFIHLEPILQDSILEMTEKMFDIFKLAKEASEHSNDSRYPAQWPPELFSVKKSYNESYGRIEDHDYFESIFGAMHFEALNNENMFLMDY